MRFQQKTLELLKTVREILAEYDFPVTIRQVFYRLVAAHVIENTSNAYTNLDKHLVNARNEGLIDPDDFEDPTRAPWRPECFVDLSQYKEEVRKGYRRDKWASQPQHLELWVEKEALVGLLRRVAAPLDIITFACHGWTSFTSLWEAARRFEEIGKAVHILYFGDFDPPGWVMPESIAGRLHELTSVECTIYRQALTPEQIVEHDIIPDAITKDDTRRKRFIAEHGNYCAELDAVPPDALQELAREGIAAFIDEPTFRQEIELEKEEEAEWERQMELLED